MYSAISLSGFSDPEQQLRHHQVGGQLVDRADDEYDPVPQQSRVDVVGALAPTALLDHDGHHAQSTGSCGPLSGSG